MPNVSFMWTIEDYRDITSPGNHNHQDPDKPLAIESKTIYGGKRFPDGSHEYEWNLTLTKTALWKLEYDPLVDIDEKRIIEYHMDMELKLLKVSQFTTLPFQAIFRFDFVLPDGTYHSFFDEVGRLTKTFNGIGESWTSAREFPPHFIDPETGFRDHARSVSSIEQIYGAAKNCKVLCRIWIGDYFKTTVQKPITAMYSTDTVAPHLPSSLYHFFINGEFTDVEIIVDGEQIKTHKLVLQACSPVFRAMLDENNQMIEAASARIEFKDFDAAIVRLMLKFLYLEEVELPAFQERAVDLLGVADKYDLARLKTVIEKLIFSAVSFENAAETLVIADRHRATELKEGILEFMKGNKALVVPTAGFQELLHSYPKLIGEFLFRC